MKTTKLILVMLFSIAVAACGGGGGGGGGTTTDTTPPTVSSTSPANNASGVAVNAAITATFNEAISAPTITSATFTLNNGVTGTVTYSGTTATFTPTSNLAYSSAYTATITTGVKDAAGNAMTATKTWAFTTGVAPDTTPPTVSSTSPANNATGVAVNAAITATFSENISASTISSASFTLSNGVTGAVTYSGTTATFTPSSNLAYSTVYTATITTGVSDAASNAMASNYTWTFTTGTAPDTTPPTVSSTSPANSATGIAVNAAITATFSENMDTATISTATFTLNNGVTGAVTYSGTTATFTPSSNLAYSTAYTATITTGVKDAAGNAMESNYTWTFTTATFSFANVTGGCVQDNAAGLMWEVKTTDGGLRDWRKSYTNYSPAYDANHHYGTSTDASGFVAAVNASYLCGHSNWRMPTIDELKSIVVMGVGSPTINTTWFPNTIGGDYWSGTPDIYISGNLFAYGVNFSSGYLFSGFSDGDRSYPYMVRLVRYSSSTPDTTPPSVESTSPANNATGVAVNASITATFSEDDMAPIPTGAFTLNNGVTGVVTYNGTTATFTPSSNLAYSTAYTATISTAVKDSAGNAIASNYTWTFTTQAPPPIDTGISQCFEADNPNLVACNSAGAVALNNAQDGMVGRDANSATNSNTDGRLGFSYASVTGGCVLDNVTSLMWEVKTSDGGLRDRYQVYTNYDSPTSAQKWNGSAYVAPAQAEIDAATNTVGYIRRVNAQGLCGYNDWRLPTADELHSLVDYGVASYPGPTVDANWFPNTSSGAYWSASPYVGYSYVAWLVYFDGGYVVDLSGGRDVFRGDARSAAYYPVRLVRAGQSQIFPRYTVSADGQEVTDNQTKLIWRRCAEGKNWDGSNCAGTAFGFTHQNALQRATAQASSTGVAWRLPNVKEFASIADKNFAYPAIDSIVFPATPSTCGFWTASPKGFQDAWAVGSSDGRVFSNGSYSRNNAYCARLVRAGQ